MMADLTPLSFSCSRIFASDRLFRVGSNKSWSSVQLLSWSRATTLVELSTDIGAARRIHKKARRSRRADSGADISRIPLFQDKRSVTLFRGARVGLDLLNVFAGLLGQFLTEIRGFGLDGFGSGLRRDPASQNLGHGNASPVRLR